MQINEFIKKHDITLLDGIYEYCNEGLELMKNSVCPLHDENHIYRLIGYLDEFIINQGIYIKSKIDFNVLIFSIVWHDIFRSSKNPKSIFGLLFNHLFDGIGSMRIFCKKFKRLGLDKKIYYNIKYCIKKHCSSRFFFHKSIESKILYDLDSLDLWNCDRLNFLQNNSINNVKKKYKPLLRYGNLYYIYYMKYINEKRFYFDWTKGKFYILRSQFETNFQNILNLNKLNGNK